MKRLIGRVMVVYVAVMGFSGVSIAYGDDGDITIPCSFDHEKTNNSSQFGSNLWMEYVIETKLLGIPCQIGAIAEGSVLGVSGSAISGHGIIVGTASRQVPVPSAGTWVSKGKHWRGSIIGDIFLGETSNPAEVSAPEEEEPPPPDCPELSTTAPPGGPPVVLYPQVALLLLALMAVSLVRRDARRWAMSGAIAVAIAAALATPLQADEFDPCDPPDSPLLIDTDGDGFQLTNPRNGVAFDLDADGDLEQVGWTKANSDDVWLAMDRNGNGRIDDGSELFGNNTPVYPSGPVVTASNGFDAAQFLEGSCYGGGLRDSRLDRNDAAFTRLLLWRDANHNGISEQDELTPAAQSAIQAISLQYTIENTVKRKNTIRQRAKVDWQNGPRTDIVDVWLAAR